MSASEKLRWKRMVNEIRFLHTEKELVLEIVHDSGAKFHEHYLKFAAEKGLDVQRLNRENDQRLKNIYGEDPPKISPANFSDLQAPTTGSMTLHEGISLEDREEYNELKDDKEIRESFRKLFKKLAIKLHPDKMTASVTIEQGMENLKLFKEAQSALSDQRYFVLLDLADRFNVTQPRNYKQQVRWMKRESERLADAVTSHKKTYNYLFSECNTEDEKDNLVRRFIAHLFGIRVE